MSVLRKFSQRVHAPNGDRRASSEQAPHSASSSPGPTPRRSLAQVLHLDRTGYVSSSDYDSETSDFDSDGLSKNAQKRAILKQKKREHRSRLSLEQSEESAERLKKRLEEATQTETDEMKARYGELPLMQSATRGTVHRIELGSITEDMVGQEVTFRCRLHHVRNLGSKLVFLIFRQQITTLQGVLVEEPGKIGPLMVHWAEHLRTASIMLVKGVLQKPQIPVKSASIHNVEVHITELHVIVKRADPGEFIVVDPSEERR